MIEVRVPNNITEYKPKFLFGMTGKQFLCVAATAVVILLDIKFLKPVIGDMAIMLAAVPAVIAAAFGWIEPYGMPFEKYLGSVLFQALLAPKHRTVKYTDASVVPCDKNYVPIPDEALNPEVLQCVQQVRDALGIVVEEEPPKKFGASSGKKPMKAKKVRYRKSKHARL